VHALKRAYQILYKSGLKLEVALAKIESEDPTPETLHLVSFVRRSSRGICRE
jgi:UDP-N-acetylglucosamine acyltransferase